MHEGHRFAPWGRQGFFSVHPVCWPLQAAGTLALCLLILFMFGCGQDSEITASAREQKNGDEPVRVVYVDWSSEKASAHVIQAVIENKLDKLLAEIPEMISSPKIQDMVIKLRRDSANLKEIENQAFELVSRGDKKEAADLLAGWPYIKGGMQFENTTRELVDLVQRRIEDKSSLQRTLSVALLGGIAVCLAALAFSWTRTAVLWRSQLRNKEAAEKALQQ
ncbi:MAG: hypothetical protein ACLFPB_09680, partial [Desulfovermiculus sp.]